MDDEFIEEVKNRPELYNKADKYYKDNTRKEIVWRVIGQKFKIKEPKLKWFNLRDKYVKLKKKFPDSSKSYTWRYFEQLTFLDPHLNRRKEKGLKNVNTEQLKGVSQDFLNEENGIFETATKFEIDDYPTCNDQVETENPFNNEDSRTNISNERNSEVKNIENVDIESFMEALPMMHTKNLAEEEDEDSYFLHSIRMEMRKMSYVDKTDLKISILKKVKEYRQSRM